MYTIASSKTQRVGGVMVSIVAFQAVDPSSILGHRKSFTIFSLSYEDVQNPRSSAVAHVDSHIYEDMVEPRK